MKKSFLSIMAFVLLILGMPSLCSAGVRKKQQQAKDNTNWNAAAEEATQSLIKHFWNKDTHYFNYIADEFNLDTHPGYWPQAHAMDAIVDAFLRTGDEKYYRMFGEWYEGIKAVNSTQVNVGYCNDYFDDTEWIALTMLRIYNTRKEERYLSTAKVQWEWVKSGWNDYCGGGIAWERSKHLWSKNACSNGPGALLGARMYQITHNAADLEWAEKIYEWERSHLYNPQTGAIYDNMNGKTGEISDFSLTYNQGTFLGAAHELYKITGKKQYLDDAQQAAVFAITDKSQLNAGQNVLRDEGKGDGGLFKGILMRYFVRLMKDPDIKPENARMFEDFFNHNVQVLWQEGKEEPLCLFGPDWTKAPGASTQLTSQTSACMTIEAKAWVDAHDKVFRKSRKTKK